MFLFLELITSLQCLGLLVWEHLKLMTIWKVKQHFDVAQAIHFFHTQEVIEGWVMPDQVISGINNLFLGVYMDGCPGKKMDGSALECLKELEL